MTEGLLFQYNATKDDLADYKNNKPLLIDENKRVKIESNKRVKTKE